MRPKRNYPPGAVGYHKTRKQRRKTQKRARRFYRVASELLGQWYKESGFWDFYAEAYRLALFDGDVKIRKVGQMIELVKQ